jgi:hypothetical protein
MYISRHRHVLMNNDFWNAERASPAVEVRPSGSRSRRRMNRSADERDDSTGGEVVGVVGVVEVDEARAGATVSIGGWSAVVLMAAPNGTSP